jgi:RNA polymerase sigma factor (sigma-70 family)
MQNWRKNRNFRKFKNADGDYIYVIKADGEKMKVSKKVYTAYAKGGYKMENMDALKCDRVLKDANGKAVRDENGNTVTLPEREVSLDKLIDEDWDFPSSAPSPEDILLAAEFSEVDELHRCIALLDEDEQALIRALFFEGLTERQYAEKLGISKTALHARKVKVLIKIKNLMRS